jgi:hypothetical protein
MARNYDAEAPSEKTSGASSLDPHLIPPPRQGGGSRKESRDAIVRFLESASRPARCSPNSLPLSFGGGTRKARGRQNTGGRALARPPAAPHPQPRPTLLKRGCSPSSSSAPAAHRPLDSRTAPRQAVSAPAATHRHRLVPPGRHHLLRQPPLTLTLSPLKGARALKAIPPTPVTQRPSRHPMPHEHPLVAPQLRHL